MRYGYRRVHVILQREGWAINHKKVRRIYNDLAVQSRHFLERIDVESFGLFCPGLADELVGCEAFECFEPLGEVVSGDEVGEMGP